MSLFSAGDPVRVRDDWPETGGAVHIRTPHYVRGMPGEIRAYLGRFPNPEDLAFARPARDLALYHVAFPRQAIWPEGQGDDEILIEIYETWLERA
ncbi:SH3-like domain-containing protein [Acidocella sp. C78]|uniref:SH3-like domain-containing protein n=1 Tax=Acidocella sp. C78 TaxID=1671486 RepID=UPI00191B8F67